MYARQTCLLLVNKELQEFSDETGRDGAQSPAFIKLHEKIERVKEDVETVKVNLKECELGKLIIAQFHFFRQLEVLKSPKKTPNMLVKRDFHG